MKQIMSLVLLLCFCTNCASMRRHPVIYGMVAGGVVGLTVGLTHRGTCPHTINGYPYDGTPPCPNPTTYDPGGRKR